MTVITTRLTVAPDGTISTTTPLPAGEYQVAIAVADAARPGQSFTLEGFPSHDLGWDSSISLRREDIYDDDGP